MIDAKQGVSRQHCFFCTCNFLGIGGIFSRACQGSIPFPALAIAFPALSLPRYRKGLLWLTPHHKQEEDEEEKEAEGKGGKDKGRGPTLTSTSPGDASSAATEAAKSSSPAAAAPSSGQISQDIMANIKVGLATPPLLRHLSCSL